MCGITFLHEPQTDPTTLKERGERALNRMAHRGPDGTGQWSDSGTVIGHRRLAIIDVAGSPQPAKDPSGRFILTYNGEIYNYRDLRKELSNQWEFRTAGDTEVLLAGLAIFGASFLKRMEGMWAFAFWDTQLSKLLLARDRMGKKPLYYCHNDRQFACASELPTLHALSGSAWHESSTSTADYLRYGYYLPGTTAYREVNEVLPGHVLRWSPNENPSQERYWQLNIGHYEGTQRNAAEELREKFTIAVRRRMVADVEVGAFLSGGVDSSLVVGVMVRELNVRPKTFTIGFADERYDESMYARAVSRTWNTEHYEHELQGWDPHLLAKLVLDHMGQPFYDSSLLPTAHVSRLAAEHVKVALSGDGGDELFSGYQRYQARMLLRWYSRLPSLVRQSAQKLILHLPEPFSHHSRSLLKKAHLFLDIADRAEDERPYVAPLLYSQKNFSKLVPDIATLGHSPPALPSECRLDSVQEMMAGDSLVYLPQDILAKVDRASMAYSLEARCPFLDRGVVELAFSIPRRWHRDHLSGKRLLRDAFRHLLPNSVLNRRKQGFAVPVHNWFRSKMGAELEAMLRETKSPLSRDYSLALLTEHRAGRRDHGYRLWGMYAYLLWLTSSLKKHAY